MSGTPETCDYSVEIFLIGGGKRTVERLLDDGFKGFGPSLLVIRRAVLATKALAAVRGGWTTGVGSDVGRCFCYERGNVMICWCSNGVIAIEVSGRSSGRRGE